MLKATIGGVDYPISQYKLRELIAAGPYLDKFASMNDPDETKRAFDTETVAGRYALMEATLGVVLPGIQAATVNLGEPLSKSPITLDFLVASMAEEEFQALSALIPHLKEAAGVQSGELQKGSAPATAPGGQDQADPSPSNAEPSSLS